MWDLATDTKPVARKRHTCDHCGNSIDAGEQYERRDGLWEGEFESFKSHVGCLNAVDAIHKLHNLTADDEYFDPGNWEQSDWRYLAENCHPDAERLMRAYKVMVPLTNRSNEDE